MFDLGAEAGVDIFMSADDGQGRLIGPAALFTQYEALVVEGDAELVPDLGDSAIFEPGFCACMRFGRIQAQSTSSQLPIDVRGAMC